MNVCRRNSAKLPLWHIYCNILFKFHLMKMLFSLLFLFLYQVILGQDTTVSGLTVNTPDSLSVKTTDSVTIDKPVNDKKTANLINNDSSADTRARSQYGDLLNDDPQYNKKYPAWIPAVRV